MPYTSRLQAVFRVRQLREEEAYQAWVVAKNLLLSEQEQMNRLTLKFNSTLDEMALHQQTMTAEEMMLYFRFIRSLQEQIARQKEVVMRHEAACEEKRVLLEQAVRERKVVGQIEDKRKAAYYKTLFYREQASLENLYGRVQHEAE